MGASKTILAILLATIAPAGFAGSELYLRRVGPPPMRFAALSSNSKPYVWPIPLIPSRPSTNSTIETASSLLNAPTNAVLVANPVPPPPNNVPGPEISSTSPPITPQTSVGIDGNPLAASNLLIVTPQMLADYFKSTLGVMDKGFTNAPSGPEVLFNPPVPKPPSSEAVYRTQ